MVTVDHDKMKYVEIAIHKAAITQNETNIPSLHCLCIMREKLLL